MLASDLRGYDCCAANKCQGIEVKRSLITITGPQISSNDKLLGLQLAVITEGRVCLHSTTLGHSER